jgi:serine phosphatase RsbU (regulator of sigma subunit)
MTLATLSMRTIEDVAVVRNKILALGRALTFPDVTATRMAFAISQQARRLLECGQPLELTVGLDGLGGRAELVLAFRGQDPMVRVDGLLGPFDSVRQHNGINGAPASLILARSLPFSAVQLDEAFLHQERAKLAKKSRAELMEQLRVKNEQLERYASQLEQMVAERTAELEQAYTRIKQDLATASSYVRRLIPPICDDPVRIRWSYVPSADLGGDIFGYHQLDTDHLAFFLLDVTGHGVDSALLAVSVQNILRSESLPGIDFRNPGAVLEALNNAFPMERFGDKLFTIWYGVFHRSSQKLRWTGGGHPPALLYRVGSQTPELLESDGPMLGMIQGVAFADFEVSVRPGDRLFLYSDGAHEVQQTDGQTWTFDEFLQYVSQTCWIADPLESLLAHVRRLNGTEQLDDDFSVMDLRF